MIKYIFTINGTPIRVFEYSVNPSKSFLEEEIAERVDLSEFEITKIISSPGTPTGIYGRISYSARHGARTFTLRAGTATKKRRAYAISSASARLSA